MKHTLTSQVTSLVIYLEPVEGRELYAEIYHAKRLWEARSEALPPRLQEVWDALNDAGWDT